LFALFIGIISLLYATVGQAGGTAFLAWSFVTADPEPSSLLAPDCSGSASCFGSG
jgi:hypothetical protein